MGNLILTLLLVVLFALTCRGLIASLKQPVKIFEPQEYFSLTARRIEKFYKTAAWLLMAILLFVSLFISFWETFTQLPG